MKANEINNELDNTKNKANYEIKNTKIIEENKNIIVYGIENMEKKEKIENNSIIKNENFKNEKNPNPQKTSIKENLLNEIKYGIDENGNPMDVDEYYKNIYNKTKRPRPIAYIVKDNNDNNILVDLNGNKIIDKNKEGDYELPFQFKILIKDFDVKHPELRINGERIYSFDNNKKNKIINDIDEKIENKNNLDFKKEEIVDEISFQIDSTETDDVTSSKTNNNINSFFKRNMLNKKEYMNIWKYRYGQYNSNNITTNNLKRENSISVSKDKNMNQNRTKNLSFSRSISPIDQEIISRTSSILNLNTHLIHFKNNSTKNNVIFRDKYNLKKIKDNNNSKKEVYKIYINNDYYNKDHILSSSPDKNTKKTYFMNSKKRNINCKIRNNIILSSLNSQRKIINDCNYCTKTNKYYSLNNYINNSINKRNTLTKLFTSPSSDISKNKKKGIFYDLNKKINKSNFYSYSNDVNNNNHSCINRVKNKLINKDLMFKLNKNEIFENKIQKSKNINTISFANINNKEGKNNSKSKKGNLILHSSIRTIEFSENSIIDNNNKENNVYGKETDKIKDIKNKKINKNNKINKLLKKIPIFPKKKNKNSMKRYSILTKEANDMITNYFSRKTIQINKIGIRNNSFLNNENINNINFSSIIKKKNQSYNKKNK